MFTAVNFRTVQGLENDQSLLFSRKDNGGLLVVLGLILVRKNYQTLDVGIKKLKLIQV